MGKMCIIDFHSHILPDIDDGSRNVETSIEMLQTAREQGVQVQIATPHFYADRDRVDDFLKRRQKAYDQVMEHHKDQKPKILLGAEVTYFYGISKAQDVSRLTVDGTNLLLLEMPFDRWTDSMLEEVRVMIVERGFQVIIAHLERYLKIPNNQKKIKELLELPVLVQVNAEALCDWKRRRPILKMFKNKKAHLIGSDAHGMHHRPPNLFDGRQILEHKLGKDYLDQVDYIGSNLISHIV
jgi:protein-tyrosine phosphatase